MKIKCYNLKIDILLMEDNATELASFIKKRKIYDVDDLRIHDHTILHNSIFNKSIKCIRLLIQLGVNLDKPYDRANALVMACEEYRQCRTHEDHVVYMEIIKVLITAGSNCNMKSNNTHGEWGNKNQCNGSGYTCLMWLSVPKGLPDDKYMDDHVAIVKLLLDHGANRGITDGCDNVARTFAYRHGFKEIYEVLKNYNPKTVKSEQVPKCLWPVAIVEMKDDGDDLDIPVKGAQDVKVEVEVKHVDPFVGNPTDVVVDALGRRFGQLNC